MKVTFEQLKAAFNRVLISRGVDSETADACAWRYDHPGDAIYAPLLLKQLSDRKPADCVVTTDVGQHQMWAAQHIAHPRPENFITQLRAVLLPVIDI